MQFSSTSFQDNCYAAGNIGDWLSDALTSNKSVVGDDTACHTGRGEWGVARPGHAHNLDLQLRD